METMRKVLALFLVVLMSVSVFAGCSKADSTAAGETSEAAESATPVKVVLLTSSGGLGDRSFNDAAYAGLKVRKKSWGRKSRSLNRNLQRIICSL